MVTDVVQAPFFFYQLLGTYATDNQGYLTSLRADPNIGPGRPKTSTSAHGTPGSQKHLKTVYTLNG